MHRSQVSKTHYVLAAKYPLQLLLQCATSGVAAIPNLGITNARGRGGVMAAPSATVRYRHIANISMD